MPRSSGYGNARQSCGRNLFGPIYLPRVRHRDHELYSITNDRYFCALAARARSCANKRNILFLIDGDVVIDQYLKQNGVCAVTSFEFDFSPLGKRGHKKRNYLAPSIDRVDSRGIYDAGNIQLVISAVNVMKNDMPVKTFVALGRPFRK